MAVAPFLIFTICLFIIAYRYYSGFIAAKVLALDAKAAVPAKTHFDGHNYFPTNKWVLFGHHFAAIAGAGPLIGPVLAAQFGFLPGFLWLVIGVVLGGAVHDFIILTASVRHDGKSLAQIAKVQLGPIAGHIASLAVLFVVIIALAGLGLAVVNALSESAWGTFTVAFSIPLALAMGLYIYKFNQGSSSAIIKASVVGVSLLLFAVIFGKNIAATSWGQFFHLSRSQIIIFIGSYGFIASILPVWMLLCPRDYLSSYLKLGTILALLISVLVVQPDLKMPAITQWVHGGGPIFSGKVFPFVFITIACGAISGFHGLVAGGTTPKMLSNETHAQAIGYGAMILEGLIGVVALVAACALNPSDYFAINTTAEKFRSLGLTTENLPQLASIIGERLEHRPGGAVSLAVGIAQIFSALPFMKNLLAYWYHFAIMFEALFILTTIDTGTRAARFLVQETFFKNQQNLFTSIFASSLVVLAWTYLIATGSIASIWPMFGVANQLLAAIGLMVMSRYLVSLKKQRYLAITLVPLTFVSITTISAAILTIRDIFWPGHFYLNTGLTLIMLFCTVIILALGLTSLVRSK